ncbi:CCAAT/enhancer-binding protein zeta [Neocloeon triangulifer]|uniref:CCAAT/enhancer-binding protein zeta n=1 Tax=Neocloeon triangulifer TaxID=2078957 RepID=UPI00286F3CEB|nr:CCAAT/enhancer-binding protein zeta [Neocloeon triangulifer]
MKSNHFLEGDLAGEAPPKWYQNEPKIDCKEAKTEDDQNLIFKYTKLAENLFAEEVLRFNNKQLGKNRYQNNWMQTIMSKGTLGDKVAAQIVQVQNSPLHSLSALSSLIGMVKVGKKKESLQVMENLVELWLNDLLRPDTKLIPFNARPLAALEKLDQTQSAKCLLYWWFEGKLKDQYTNFVKALDQISKDSVDSIKSKAISCLSQLLTANPEQEQLILSQLVNKLGDPQQAIASKTMHDLQQVLRKHPNMQPVVLEEVERMIFRPNIQSKAQYYAVCFLVQFHLSHEDKKLATAMINLYFCLFKVCINKGELESKLLQILLNGVKRAFPYAKDSFVGTLADHLDTLHKLIHVSSFGIALHALCLLYQVAQASSLIEDRFYSSLYKKLLDPEVIKTKHHALFLNIVYKSVNKDTQIPRAQAFIKRLLQLALSAPCNLASSLLYLISQLVSKRKDLITLETKTGEERAKFDDDDEDDEEKYVDVKLDDEEKQSENPLPKPSGSWSWVAENKGQKSKSDQTDYQPFTRNPTFARAEKVGLRELSLLANHHHPTVALFAQNILNGENIRYSGDMLVDFSATRFLDRFCFKNPKKESLKEHIFSRTSQYQPKGIRSLRVNSTRYLNMAEDQIPKEDLFLYQYMQKKMQSLSEKKEAEGEEESDNESVNSEEFEKMLFGNRKDDDSDEDEEDEEQDAGLIDFEQEVEEAEKKNKGTKKKKKRQLTEDDMDDDMSDEGGLPSDFATADQFAEMLQNAGIEDVDMAGSSAVRNADNSHVKQLRWEQDREKRFRGAGQKWKQKGRPNIIKGKKKRTK